MEIIFSLDEIDVVASSVISQNLSRVILFNGEMGAGKTTFIKALSKVLGVKDSTGSPTFSLVNEYRTSKNEIIFHFDVYRLKSEVEAYDMGMDEYLYSGNWCFVEWAEKIPNLIPEDHSVISIEVIDGGLRKLKLT